MKSIRLSAPAEDALHVARVNSLGFLASGLSHELLQPLSAIVGFAEGTLRRLRAQQADVGDVLYALEEIVSRAHSAGDILNRLRSLVQKRPYVESKLSLAGLVEEVLSLHESRMRLSQIHARFEFTSDLPASRGDPVQIKQVLLNLVSNALDAIEERNSGERLVTVRTRLDQDSELETTIADTGRGMTKQQLSKLFTPYFSTKSHGLGVGLTISKTIIEAHGGRLWGQPNSERGMTFGFTLPVLRRENRASIPTTPSM